MNQREEQITSAFLVRKIVRHVSLDSTVASYRHTEDDLFEIVLSAIDTPEVFDLIKQVMLKTAKPKK